LRGRLCVEDQSFKTQGWRQWPRDHFNVSRFPSLRGAQRRSNPGAAPRLKDIVLDVRLLRSWFASLDTDGNNAVDFLEYRDHTMLSLELFQRLDLDRKGTINFKEFLGPVAVTAERGGLQVNEEMLRWIEGELTKQVEETQATAAVAAPARSAPTNPATVILARARARSPKHFAFSTASKSSKTSPQDRTARWRKPRQ